MLFQILIFFFPQTQKVNMRKFERLFPYVALCCYFSKVRSQYNDNYNENYNSTAADDKKM